MVISSVGFMSQSFREPEVTRFRPGRVGLPKGWGSGEGSAAGAGGGDRAGGGDGAGGRARAGGRTGGPEGSSVGWAVPGVGVRRIDGSDLPAAPALAGLDHTQPPRDAAELVECLRRAATGMTLARDEVRALTPAQLTDLMTALGTAAVAIEAMTVTVTAEALARGLPGSGSIAMTPVDWVKAHHAGLRGLGAAQMVAVATMVGRPGLTEIAEAVQTGVIPLPAAACAARETAKVLSVLPTHQRHDDEVRDSVIATLVGVAAGGIPQQVRATGMELVAALAGPHTLDKLAARSRSQRELTVPSDLGTGVYEYLLRTDALGMATLEAALDPVSAPTPGPDGTPDPRTPRQRRHDGLLTLIEAAVAAPDGPPSGLRGQLHLTMTLDALTDALTPAATSSAPMTRAQTTADPTCHGRVLGQAGPAGHAVLAPSQARHLACNAGLIPLILDTAGIVVDQGHLTRFFPPNLVARLWQRDRGCSYPGCTMPAKWTQAHHLTWYRDQGTTSITNGALLCSYHHHVVHARRLHGHVDPHTGHVEWNLTPGSYDHPPP